MAKLSEMLAGMNKDDRVLTISAIMKKYPEDSQEAFKGVLRRKNADDEWIRTVHDRQALFSSAVLVLLVCEIVFEHMKFQAEKVPGPDYGSDDWPTLDDGRAILLDRFQDKWMELTKKVVHKQPEDRLKRSHVGASYHFNWTIDHIAVSYIKIRKRTAGGQGGGSKCTEDVQQLRCEDYEAAKRDIAWLEFLMGTTINRRSAKKNKEMDELASFAMQWAAQKQKKRDAAKAQKAKKKPKES